MLSKNKIKNNWIWFVIDVNEFTINELPVWFDKITRSGLITINNAVQMLYALEVYASACYDNTQKHLTIVDSLETIEEVLEYNYKTGYPEKLEF